MFLFSKNSLAYCIAYIRVNFTSKFSAFLGCGKFPREKKIDNVFVFHLNLAKIASIAVKTKNILFLFYKNQTGLLQFINLCELCFTYAAFLVSVKIS
jgi:hypothetical protein